MFRWRAPFYFVLLFIIVPVVANTHRVSEYKLYLIDPFRWKFASKHEKQIWNERKVILSWHEATTLSNWATWSSSESVRPLNSVFCFRQLRILKVSACIFSFFLMISSLFSWLQACQRHYWRQGTRGKFPPAFLLLHTKRVDVLWLCTWEMLKKLALKFRNQSLNEVKPYEPQVSEIPAK